jgi:hypothetical protein
VKCLGISHQVRASLGCSAGCWLGRGLLGKKQTPRLTQPVGSNGLVDAMMSPPDL